MSPAEQPQSAPEELLSVSSVARRLGVAPATLRTWARRYGLGPSSHEAGSHRKYCPSDLAKLTVMRRLISAGVAPADAAEQAKAHEGEVVIEEFTSLCRECDETIDAIYNAADSSGCLMLPWSEFNPVYGLTGRLINIFSNSIKSSCSNLI